jgi:5-methylcytosine-specific restriction endonuclease McrA
MHPWFGKTFTERKACHAEFKQWLADHPLLRIKHGTVREDGRVFCGYSTGYVNGENWTSPDAFERRSAHARVAAARNRRKPGANAKYREYIKTQYPNIEMRRRKTRDRGATWRKENLDRVAQKTRRRYAMKRSLIHPENDRRKERRFFAEAARLTRETGIEHHVDHIIPISAGGWHHHDNLQVLTIGENLTKGSDPFCELPGRKSWRDVPEHLWPSMIADQYRHRAA